MERLGDEFPVLVFEEQYICLGGNHKIQQLKKSNLRNLRIKYKSPQLTVYEGLLKEECWRVANLHNIHKKASKAKLTFQDQLFQARRLKDSLKMRETLSKYNVDDKASKALLTFQDQLFQARRLKDSLKMRETLSKYNVDEKARKAMLSFQDQLFQARRPKDSLKMRETLSKYNVDDKASKAMLSFQDQLFQARRPKDSQKMREKLCKVFDIGASQTKSQFNGDAHFSGKVS